MTAEEITETLLLLSSRPEAWASNRAGYMLSVQAALRAGTVTESQARDWMYDVMRTLDQDSTDSTVALEIIAVARAIGQIPE